MLNSKISGNNAMSVAIAANEEQRAMRTVPELWYLAPQSPNNRARPDRTVAVGWEMRVNVP